jgi:V-type H+-transporting ATPase subunit e
MGAGISHDAQVIIIGTCIFLALGLIVVPISFCFRKQQVLILTLSTTTTICTWMMWLMIFLSQMNPLVQPQRKEEGVACNIL